MPDEDHAAVLQVAQFDVRRLECGQMLRAEVSVEVTWLDTGELGEVIDDLLLCRDVIIDERGTFIWSLTKISLKKT